MTKFAHISDVHLGGWKAQPLQDLNFKSFQKAINICINSKLNFILIAGDLFDSAYPPIEILKETFAEFRKLKEARIPCFIIAGSHDYSVSGKTFLDVLEKAGFCKNVTNFEEKEETIILNPTIHEGVAIYGYPGKKSGLEVQDLRKIKFNDAPGMFKILMLHTTIDKAKGTLPIDAIETEKLPYADYYALGHLHIDFKYKNFVYPGPIFPNNFQELEDLKHGSFYIVDTESINVLQKIELIISKLEEKNIQDKIVLLRIHGELKDSKNSDIKFSQIEEYIQNNKAYFMLKNTHNLKTKEIELEKEIKDSENIENETIKVYSQENPSALNELIPQIMNALLIEESKKVLNF